MRLAASFFLACSLGFGVALGAETGNVCVQQYSPGNGCSGSDVTISKIAPVSVLEDCASGDPGSAVAVFEIWISGGAQSRYDIGVFLALNGGSALTGTNCLHDFLEPPLDPHPVYGDSDGNGRSDLPGGPWWNGEPFVPGDDCGDLEAGTDAIKTLVSFRFSCTDNTGNGFVDFSTCTSWSAGTSSTCPGLGGAVPGGQTRCSCNVLEMGVPMPGTAVASGLASGLKVDREAPGNLRLSWNASCSGTDTDYEIYEGALGSFYSHQQVLCTTGGATSATIPPGADGRYYLVVPRNALREGSYGTRSSGTQRPAAAIACLAQLAGSCP